MAAIRSRPTRALSAMAFTVAPVSFPSSSISSSTCSAAHSAMFLRWILVASAAALSRVPPHEAHSPSVTYCLTVSRLRSLSVLMSRLR